MIKRTIFFQLLLGVFFISLTTSLGSCASSSPNTNSSNDDPNGDDSTKAKPSFQIIVTPQKGKTIDKTDTSVLITNGQEPKTIVYKLLNKDLFSAYSATLSFKALKDGSSQQIATTKKTENGILFTLPDTKNPQFEQGTYSLTFQGTYVSDGTDTQATAPLVNYVLKTNGLIPAPIIPAPDPDPEFDSGDAAAKHFNSSVIINAGSKRITVNYKDVESTNGVYTVDSSICAKDVTSYPGMVFNFQDNEDAGTTPIMDFYVSDAKTSKNLVRRVITGQASASHLPGLYNGADGQGAYSKSADASNSIDNGPLSPNYYYYATFQTQVPVEGAAKPYRATSPIIKFTC
jgi:hypothetical protein